MYISLRKAGKHVREEKKNTQNCNFLYYGYALSRAHKYCYYYNFSLCVAWWIEMPSYCTKSCITICHFVLFSSIILSVIIIVALKKKKTSKKMKKILIKNVSISNMNVSVGLVAYNAI